MQVLLAKQWETGRNDFNLCVCNSYKIKFKMHLCTFLIAIVSYFIRLEILRLWKLRALFKPKTFRLDSLPEQNYQV